MKLKKCFFCDKITVCPYHVTEIGANGSVESCSLCAKCWAQYTGNTADDSMAKPKPLDLSHIKTPEELLSFITGLKEPSQQARTCSCGWSLEDFDRTGRFGCPKCYETYADKLEELVFPYHGASQHVGKRPKGQINRNLESDPVEKQKLLKLRLAKAVELEEYEKAAEIKKELDQLKAELQPSTSSDQ